MKVYDFGWLYKIKLMKIISFQKRSCQEVIHCNYTRLILIRSKITKS